ncbi:MAG: MATE family efflux transporter [Planctomycetia bacterium]|nr:MATE family efflux transporter [Planctomycetia bacterium]
MTPLDHSPRFRAMAGEAIGLLRLGGPIVAAQLAQMSMGFVDTVMAGRLSALDLAAVAVGNSIWMTVLIFGWGLLLSVSPTVAHFYGARKIEEIGPAVRQGLWLSLAVAVCTFAGVHSAAPVFHWLQVEPEIVPTAVGFLNASSCGLPATCAFTVLRGFSEAVGKSRPIMVISLIGVASNVAGNLIFMYGRFGMPRLGAIGCGVASAITMWIMAASLAVWIVCDRYYRPYAVFGHWELPRRAQLARLLKLGGPIGIGLLMEVSMFATVSLLMGHLGTEIVAGHQIAVNVASITFMVPLGLSVAMTVRVGHAMGRRDPRAARRSGAVGATLCAGFMSLMALAMAFFPHLIASIYSDDEAVRSTAVGLLLMAAIFQILDGLQVAGAAALRGLKDTAIPMVITCVAYWGLGLPLGYTLGMVHERGPQALWIGLIAGLTAAALLLNMRFWLVTRRLVRQAECEAVDPGIVNDPADVEPDMCTPAY